MRFLTFFFILFAWPAVALEPWQDEAVADVNRYINGLTSYRADFIQESPEGEMSRGVFYLSRPDKIRWEYKHPDPLILLIKNKSLVYYDVDLDEISHIPLEDELADLLGRENLNLKQDAEIIAVAHKELNLAVTIEDKAKKAPGRVTLIFQPRPLKLIGMDIIDATSRVSTITFRNIQRDIALDRTLFHNPKREKRRIKH